MSMTQTQNVVIRSFNAGRKSAGDVRRRGSLRERVIAGYAMIAPNAVLYTLFVLIPALVGVVLCFFSWDFFGPPEFVGFANFTKAFTDPQAWHAIGITFLFLIFGVLPTVFLGFAIAVLVNSNIKGVGVVRVLYFAPIVVSSAVASVLWSWLYQPQSGVFNFVLSWFGIDGPAWLVSTTWALPALTVMLIWMSMPLVIILYLAALQRIPTEIIEASMIDGANAWTRLWKIMWPNVSAMTILVVALQVIHFLGAPLEVSLIMTQGGPVDSTTSLSLYIYKMAFERGQVGYGATLAVIQFLLILLLGGGLRLIYKMRASR
jgi:multiple sugar transport system permease protein